MRVVNGRVTASGGVCAPVPAEYGSGPLRFQVRNGRVSAARRTRWERMQSALTAAGEMTTTYDMLYGSPGDRFFQEQALKAGHANVGYDRWPCESEGIDASGAIFNDGGNLVFVTDDGLIVGASLSDGWMRVRVAAPEAAQIPGVFSAFRSKYPAAYLTQSEDPRVPITFWANSQFGPQPRLRRVDSAEWDEIVGNYSAEVGEKLAAMMSWNDGPPAADGQLLLWQGPPGTGKSWALRALASEWSPWAEFHYITDPDSFFVDDPSYMVNVLLADSYSVIDEPSGDVYDEQRDGKWRVLILEDTGELLSANAKEKYGQGLSRLLNVVDGMIGQGLRVLALVTTNDELGDLHPAVTRSGRCAMQIEFGPLTDEEAARWTGDPEAAGGTLADLYAKYGKAEDAFADTETDPREEIVRVAAEHAPDGGYGETSWNADTKTVFWVCADWTGIEEHDAAEAAFLAIPGVEHWEHDAECNPPSGDGWEVVYPEGMTASTYVRVKSEQVARDIAEQRPLSLEDVGVLLAKQHDLTLRATREMFEEARKASLPDPLHLLASAIEALKVKAPSPDVHFHYDAPDVRVDVKPPESHAHLNIDVKPAEAHVDVHVPEQQAPVVEVIVPQPKPTVAVPVRDDDGRIVRVEHQAVGE